ncbi:MAG: hypothetical protein Q7T02_03080 [Pseudomonas sp.]|nr:hypothetical protein [Pseudomonas sp.]
MPPETPVAASTGEQTYQAEFLGRPINDLSIMTHRADWTQNLRQEDQANLPALELQASEPTGIFLAWLNRVTTKPQTAPPG